MRFIYYSSPGGPYDADAADYIARVNAVDAANGASGGLEAGLQDIIHILFRDLKSDASPFAGVSNFAALKASCLLAGPRTRQGCAVPLLASMPTPTFQGTVGGWIYNRKNGLQGNGTNNYIDTNRANNADPRNNSSNALHVSSMAIGVLMASSSSNSGQNYMDYTDGGVVRYSSRNSANTADVAGPFLAGIYGHSRTTSGSYQYYKPQVTATASIASSAPESRNVFLLTRTNDGINFDKFSASRIGFYNVGEAATLSTLDQRISAYMTALNALTLT